MSLDQRDILNLASRDFILGNTTVDEQVDFISDQIKDPFGSGDSNYFKKLKHMVNADSLDAYCLELLDEVENVYPGLEFDLSEYDKRVEPVFVSVYKFFVKNIQKIMYTFLREYLSSAKNRKSLTAEYLNTKLPNYPKEQFGKKEYYVLISKLNGIIKDIRKEKLSLDEFISYIQRSESSPMYVANIAKYLEDGIVVDNGVVDDIFSMFMKSESYDTIYCKLQIFITEVLITPYLEENGLAALRIPPVEALEDDISDEDEDGTEES